MNEENIGSVDILKKQFESFQSSKKPVNGLDNIRHEKNSNKRNIKRTPAFRRDVNISNTRKLVDHSQSLAVTNNVKQFINNNSNTIECNKILHNIDSHNYKTDNLNQKLHVDQFSSNVKNALVSNQKTLIQCLKKKLENNSTNIYKPKVQKKNIEHTLKTSLPVGPPPKKPPRTFAHDKQADLNLPFKYVMESYSNSKSDPNKMLKKLEKFVIDNSHTYGAKNEKPNEQDFNSKRSSKKSKLNNLANSIKCLESHNLYDNSKKTYHTDEQNYLTSKLYDNDTEHIYDEPICPQPNPRLNINSVNNNCHNEWVSNSDNSNLYYMVSL